MSVRQRFAIGALLLMGCALAWSPNHRSLVKHQTSTNNRQPFELNDFRPIQWVAAGILAASVAFAPLPSEAIIDSTPVANDLSVKVQTNDDDVTISFSLPRSLIKSIDIDDNQGQAKQGDKVGPPPAMPAPENSMTDVVKGALNALSGKEEPKAEEKEESPPEINDESKPADVKNEEPNPGAANVDEPEPVDEMKVETPAAVEEKQEPAKVEEPTAEIPKQEVKKEPIAEVEAKKEPIAEVEAKKELPKSIEEKKPEPPPVEAQIEPPKPIEVKKEESPKAIIVEQATKTKSSTLSGSVLDKVNKAGEVLETPPKPEVPKPTPRVELAKPFIRKKEAPKPPPIVSKSTNGEAETETSGVGNMFNNFGSKFKGKKKEETLSYWERPAFQTAIQSRNGDIHLSVTNGQIAGVTAVGLGAVLLATFKADNSERDERRESKTGEETATNKSGLKPTGPSSGSGDARSFVDATIESSPTTTVEKDVTSENGIGSLLSAFLKPKKDNGIRDDRERGEHKRRDLQKEEAVAAAKRAISAKQKAASTRVSHPLEDSMLPTDNSSPASSFSGSTGASDSVRSEGTSRSPYGSSGSDAAVPEGRFRDTSDYGSASVGASSQQQMAAPVDGAPSSNTQNQNARVPTTRFDESTGRYVFEYGGTTIYEWEQNLEEVIIYIKAPPGITQDQIACNIFPRQLQLGLRGSDRFFIDKETYDFVVTSESSWYMNGDTIQITLQKARRGESWEHALQTLGTSSSPSRTAPAPPSSRERSNPVTSASSAAERRSAPTSGTSPPRFGASSTVTGGPPNTSTPGLEAQTSQNNSSSSAPPTSGATSSGVPGIGASSFTDALSNTGGSTSSSSSNTPPRPTSSGVPGIGASSFTDALSNASASSSKSPTSRPPGGGIPGFGATSFAGASSNTGGATGSSDTNTPPRPASSGVPGIGASSFTDALSNASASSSKPPTSKGGGIPGFGASSFAGASSSNAPPPAPRAMPPPASVPSTAPQASSPAGASTTLPSRGPATATSGASYAEQMRATAPGEAETTGDGASDEYLAAMSGATSAPRVSPPPPPAPIGRTERVMPSSTSEDANTAAGADYLSRMGGGIPQKRPPKQGSSSSSMSGGIPGFGASSFTNASSNADGPAGSSSTTTDTPSRPKSGGIPGIGANSFTDALSNPTTNSSPIPPPPAPVPGSGTDNEATRSYDKEEVSNSGPSANDSAPKPKVSLIFKNNVGDGTKDRSDSSPQVNKAVRRNVGPSPTAGSATPAETSSYSSGPAYTSRQSTSQSAPPQSSGTSRSHLDPLTGASSRLTNDASSAGNRPFMDGDSNTKTSSSPKSFNPRTEGQRRKAQEDLLAEAKRKFAEQEQRGSSKSEPPSYLGAFRKPMAPRPAASNEESEKDNKAGAFMSGLPNFSDPGRAQGYNLNPAIAEKAKQIRKAMEAAKKANQVNKNEPNDNNGPPYRRN